MKLLDRVSKHFLSVFILISVFITNSANSEVKVFYEKSKNGGYDFFAKNSSKIECWVRISFKNAENLKFDKDLPFEGIIKADTEKELVLRARPAEKNKRYGFRFSYTYVTGDPSKETDPDAVYYFPFRHGTKHKLTQGYRGRKTHFGDNEFALDFEMDEGTDVVAARDGIVAEVKEDSNIGGYSAKFDQYGNYILIYHSDGTFSNYVHLKQNGALVDVNDRVKAGQVIGLSGNTGRSSGPHLHFSVSKPDYSGKRMTIPVKFLSHDGERIDPLGGAYYYSTHYGREAFKMVLGKDIKNSHFNKYSRTIGMDGKVDIRSERVDDTILIFFRNGTDKKLSIIMDFKLVNLRASRVIPYSRQVMPGSEVYVCFLRSVDPEEGFSFATKSRYRIIR